MKALTIRQARQALTHLDELLAKEGEVTITRRGAPIARVLPLREARRIPSHASLRREMPRLRKGSERLIRDDRDAR